MMHNWFDTKREDKKRSCSSHILTKLPAVVRKWILLSINCYRLLICNSTLKIEMIVCSFFRFFCCSLNTPYLINLVIDRFGQVPPKFK
jgi:hypothetical protein